MDRLDPRQETLEVTAGTNTPSGTPVTDDYLATSDRPSPVLRHEAFVLLQPGRNLPEIVTAAFRCNETTYLVEEEVDKLRSLAAHPAVVYVEAPRPMGEDVDRSVPKPGRIWYGCDPAAHCPELASLSASSIPAGLTGSSRIFKSPRREICQRRAFLRFVTRL